MKRLTIALIAGAILGVFCIIGVGWRLGFTGNEMYLFAMWYNRVVMGLLIGLASQLKIIKSDKNYLIRGLILGIIVTLAITFSTNFKDIPSFFAGIAYGVIIDFVATKYSVP